MAEGRRKKQNVITINPLKVNEFSSRRKVKKTRDNKSKQQTKVALPGDELIDLYINDKLKASLEEIKSSTTINDNTGNGTNAKELVTTKRPKEMISRSSERQCTTTRNFPNVTRYDIRPVVPAKKSELIPVAKAMHREEFGSRLHSLFQPEKDAALEAIDSDVYIGWRCEEYTWDCIRLGSNSRCFCNHSLHEHGQYNGRSVKVKCCVINCPCKSFAFIPERPKDIGEWWLQKRPGFDLTTWRAKCKCKHTHITHDPETKICAVRGCSCFAFKSDFLCAACDRHWEDHWTFFDTAMSRREKGLPVGEEYLPFYEMAELRDIVLHGEKEGMSLQRGRIQNVISSSKSIKQNDSLVGRYGGRTAR